MKIGEEEWCKVIYIVSIPGDNVHVLTRPSSAPFPFPLPCRYLLTASSNVNDLMVWSDAYLRTPNPTTLSTAFPAPKDFLSFALLHVIVGSAAI